jgi:hypothetical protein
MLKCLKPIQLVKSTVDMGFLFIALWLCMLGVHSFEENDSVVVTNQKVLKKLPNLVGAVGIVVGDSDNNKVRVRITGKVFKLKPEWLTKETSEGKSCATNSKETQGTSPRKIPREKLRVPWPSDVERDPNTATGGPADYESITGFVRDDLFYAIHGGWPPTKQWPGGTKMKATDAWEQVSANSF